MFPDSARCGFGRTASTWAVDVDGGMFSGRAAVGRECQLEVVWQRKVVLVEQRVSPTVLSAHMVRSYATAESPGLAS